MMRPVGSPGIPMMMPGTGRGGMFKKDLMLRGRGGLQRGALRHGPSSTKQLKSLNLSKRGLIEKKKKITKKMKKQLAKAQKAQKKSINLSRKLEKKKLRIKKVKPVVEPEEVSESKSTNTNI